MASNVYPDIYWALTMSAKTDRETLACHARCVTRRDRQEIKSFERIGRGIYSDFYHELAKNTNMDEVVQEKQTFNQSNKKPTIFQRIRRVFGLKTINKSNNHN